MIEFTDSVLGRIQVRRHHNARHISFKLSPRRELIVTAPPRTPLTAIKLAARTSRKNIQKLLEDSEHQIVYYDGQQIGQSHKLHFIITRVVDQPEAKRQGTTIIVSIPPDTLYDEYQAQQAAQKAVITALKREAKSYLPRRLKILANRHDYTYKNIRFTHTTSRWGSCSSSGVISLNIALMKLPLELIDYVLIHELCHTEQMNHSNKFWQLVAKADPRWRLHRRQIKSHSPLL